MTAVASRFVSSQFPLTLTGHGDFNGITGGLAYDCLQSMPIDQNSALAFLEQYKIYLQFQSTIVTLKSRLPCYSSAWCRMQA